MSFIKRFKALFGREGEEEQQGEEEERPNRIRVSSKPDFSDLKRPREEEEEEEQEKQIIPTIQFDKQQQQQPKRRFVVNETYEPPSELEERAKRRKIELKKAMERKKEEKRKKKKARIVVVSEQTKPIGRIERGQRYQYYAIVYPVRKVVRTFESALEVVKGVTGQHWRGFNSEERALEYLCDWERIDTECISFNREKRKTRWTKMEKIVSEYPSGPKSCTKFVDPTVKDGYKYFPCENEYNTEEPIALGGEQESWSATKLSNREFGHTRSQTRDLEAVESLQQMSADKQLENEQKKAAKVDAATSLFVLRDVEKEQGKALHFARSRSLDGQLRMYKCAIFPTPKQKVVLKKFMEAETTQSYNFVVREVNKLQEEINKLFEEKKKKSHAKEVEE